MDETQNEEKLLGSPLDTPELVSGTADEPLLTTKEFLATTPRHELAEVFGKTEEETLKPQVGTPLPEAAQEAAAPQSENLSEPLVSLAEKDTLKPEAETKPVPAPKQKHHVLGFFVAFFLLCLIALVALYIWGGILKERQAAAPATENFAP